MNALNHLRRLKIFLHHKNDLRKSVFFTGKTKHTLFKNKNTLSHLVPKQRFFGFSNVYGKTDNSSLYSIILNRFQQLQRLNNLSPVPKGFEKFIKTSNEKDNSRRKQSNNSLPPPSPPPDPLLWPITLAVILCCGAWTTYPYLIERNDMFYTKKNEISSHSFFVDFLKHNYVERIEVVNKDRVNVFLKPNIPISKLPKFKGNYFFYISSIDKFETKLEQFQYELGKPLLEHVPINYTQKSNYAWILLENAPTILLCFIAVIFLRQMASLSSANNFTRPLRTRETHPVNLKNLKDRVQFSDVAGMREAKREVQEFVEFLKNPNKFIHLGAKIPKGALLVGAPGIGKTLLARAVAGEANVPFFSISGSDFIEVFVGVGPSRVRELFSKARKNSPSIIFIDEIDAVGRKRNRGGFASGANDERENTLNQLLVEMDGFSSSSGVIVLAGTNRADILDPALTRPGRFDRTVVIENPDLSERAEIFQTHMKPLKLQGTLDPNETNRRLAALTPGFVGADIRNVCNEAAILAARRNAQAVDLDDLENACERVIGGLKKSTGFFDDEIKRIVAFHEAGHAVCAWFLKHADPILKISIVPRTNGALGFAQNLPNELQLMPKQEIMDKIAVLLGGRVSEELIFGTASTGASDDLDKVTKLAYAFVSVWGFNGTVGLLSFQQRGSNSEISPFYSRPYSEDLAKLIDEEVRQLIEQEYKRVKSILSSRIDLLHALSNSLLEKETLTILELKQILGERPFKPRKALLEYVNAGYRTTHKAKLPKKEDNNQQQQLDDLTSQVEQLSTLTASRTISKCVC